MMLYIKYESTGPCSFGQEDFWKLHFENLFFNPVTYLCNQLERFEQLRGPPRDHFCEVWSKPNKRFQKRCCLKKLLTDGRTAGRTHGRRTPDIDLWITKAHLSTSCSGELITAKGFNQSRDRPSSRDFCVGSGLSSKAWRNRCEEFATLDGRGRAWREEGNGWRMRKVVCRVRFKRCSASVHVFGGKTGHSSTTTTYFRLVCMTTLAIVLGLVTVVCGFVLF